MGPDRAGQHLGCRAGRRTAAERLLVAVRDVRVGEGDDVPDLADRSDPHREWITERLRATAADALESSLCVAEIGFSIAPLSSGPSSRTSDSVSSSGTKR